MRATRNIPSKDKSVMAGVVAMLATGAGIWLILASAARAQTVEMSCPNWFTGDNLVPHPSAVERHRRIYGAPAEALPACLVVGEVDMRGLEAGLQCRGCRSYGYWLVTEGPYETGFRVGVPGLRLRAIFASVPIILRKGEQFVLHLTPDGNPIPTGGEYLLAESPFERGVIQVWGPGHGDQAVNGAKLEVGGEFVFEADPNASEARNQEALTVFAYQTSAAFEEWKERIQERTYTGVTRSWWRLFLLRLAQGFVEEARKNLGAPEIKCTTTEAYGVVYTTCRER